MQSSRKKSPLDSAGAVLQGSPVPPLSLQQVLALPPCGNTWDKIRKKLNDFTLADPNLAVAVRIVEQTVKDWPPHLSRPPLKSWRSAADPRLRICKRVHETATYNDYILALTAIKTRDGKQAVRLERQFTGKVQNIEGRDMMIGTVGAADLKGGIVLEWISAGGHPHSIEVRFELEPKAERGRASDEQLNRKAEFDQRNGLMIIAHSVDQAVQEVAAWKQNREQELAR